MTLPCFEIVWIVRWRHFDDPGAELRVNHRVRQNRNLALDQRQNSRLPVQMPVTFIIRVNS